VTHVASLKQYQKSEYKRALRTRSVD